MITQYQIPAKQYGKLFVKFAVTIFLLYWIFTLIDFPLLKNTVIDINFGYVILAGIMHLLAFLLLSSRWWILYSALDKKKSYKTAFKGYYFGLFFNNFLPTSMGGDVVRIIFLRKLGFNTSVLISSTLLDRVIGLFSIFLMGFIAIAVSPQVTLSNNYYVALVALFGIAAAIIYFLFSVSCKNLVNRFLSNIRFRRIVDIVISLMETFHKYRNDRPRILLAICISLLAQHLVIITYVFIGLSLNIDLPIYMYFSMIPVVFITSSLPISIGGLGVREGTLIALFGMFGVSTELAVALSLVYVFILLVITLPGGVFIWIKENIDIDYIDSRATTSHKKTM